MTTARYVFEDAFQRVVAQSSLRRPQRKALEALHALTMQFGADLTAMSQEALAYRIREEQPGWTFHDLLPILTCLLATGVGKTRLVGAMMAYLFLTNQSRNFCIVAPRTEVLRKMLSECQADSEKYIFGGRHIVPEPNVWHSGNLHNFRGDQLSLVIAGEGPNIFVLSPQSLAGENRRAWSRSEFTGTSPADYLRDASDLVIFADEAHHLGAVAEEDTSAWVGALRELRPRLAIGMTATPRQERGTNLLYSYDLETCLREGLYTKSVRVIVKERVVAGQVSDVEWDRFVIDYALERLDAKSRVLENVSTSKALPRVKPVLLICAADTAHADEVSNWLVESRGLSKAEVLVVHSKRGGAEADVKKLLSVESADSPVRVVVNVQKLTEGWDVSNVYVIAPLRAMATYAGAVQAMGRGLRLPFGRRLGDVEADRLDVLCFGRASLKDILDSALKQFSGIAGSSAVSVVDKEVVEADESARYSPVEVAPTDFEVEIPAAVAVPLEPGLDFDSSDLGKLIATHAAGFELGRAGDVSKADTLKIEFDVFARLCSSRVISGLSYLSEPLHRTAVLGLVHKALGAAGVRPPQHVAGDWVFLAEAIKERIDTPYRRQEVQFRRLNQSTIFSPKNLNLMLLSDTSVRSCNDPGWHNAIGVGFNGWRRSVYPIAKFDSEPEFHAAQILDRNSEVSAWLRNDPAQLRFPTPIGFYEPDFILKLVDGSMLALEVKRADFWRPPDSDPRVKARALNSWCRAVSATGASWSHCVVLDSDVASAQTLSDLLARGFSA